LESVCEDKDETRRIEKLKKKIIRFMGFNFIILVSIYR